MPDDIVLDENSSLKMMYVVKGEIKIVADPKNLKRGSTTLWLLKPK